MKYQKVLSIMPFYGGKGRMAHFIADKLDYMHTDTFVTPFGGACRVLLNKPPHPLEIYNDFSSGLCALMRVLSQRDTALELIRRVMDSEYSREQFEDAKELFDLCEKNEKDVVLQNLADYYLHEIYSLYEYKPALTKEGIRKLRPSIEKLIEKILNDTEPSKQLRETIGQNYECIKQDLERFIFDENFGFYGDADEEEIYLRDEFIKNLPLLSADEGRRGKDIYQINDIDLAFAAYIVYTMSRDGMGKEFTEYKFKDTEHYHKRAESLFACAERLEGIEVQQLDAFMFFRKGTELMEDEKTTYQAIGDWLNNPSVMMYLDPSYISPTSERESLKGINWQGVDCLSDAIKEKYQGQKEPTNLGKIYARSFQYGEQENFLRLICNAKCKILISNYDLILYDKYLTMNGWHRTEFITSTSVGSQAGNDRTEVIWWNY